ncbi:MAG: hypothetical protein RIE24_06030 [Silicimonas sp.]
MYSSNVSPKVREEVSQPRRTVSVYEKMQEARARRAALMGTSEPANDPSAAPRAEPRPAAPVADLAPKVGVSPVTPASTPEPDRTPGSRLKWIIRGLTGLLVVLVAIAINTAQFARPGPGPRFAPPAVSLMPQNTGAPFLGTVGRWADPQISPPAHTSLADAATGQAPDLSTAPPAAPAPDFVTFVDTPVAPQAQPSGVVTLSDDLRPPARPESIGTDETGS